MSLINIPKAKNELCIVIVVASSYFWNNWKRFLHIVKGKVVTRPWMNS